LYTTAHQCNAPVWGPCQLRTQIKIKLNQIPKHSRSYSVFKDFSANWETDTFSRTFKKCGHPANSS